MANDCFHNLKLCSKKVKKDVKKSKDLLEKINDVKAFFPNFRKSKGNKMMDEVVTLKGSDFQKYLHIFAAAEELCAEVQNVATRVDSIKDGFMTENATGAAEKKAMEMKLEKLVAEKGKFEKKNQKLKAQSMELTQKTQLQATSIKQLESAAEKYQKTISVLEKEKLQLLEIKNRFALMQDGKELEKRYRNVQKENTMLTKKLEQKDQLIAKIQKESEKDIERVEIQLKLLKSQATENRDICMGQQKLIDQLKKKLKKIVDKESEEQSHVLKENQELKNQNETLQNKFQQTRNDSNQLKTALSKVETEYKNYREETELELKELKQTNKSHLENLNATKDKVRKLEQSLNGERKLGEKLRVDVATFKQMVENSIPPSDPSQVNDILKQSVDKIVEIFQIVDFFDIQKPDGFDIRQKLLQDQCVESHYNNKTFKIVSMSDFSAFDHFSSVVRGFHGKNCKDSVPKALSYFEYLLLESKTEVFGGVSFQELHDQIFELGTSFVYFSTSGHLPFDVIPEGTSSETNVPMTNDIRKKDKLEAIQPEIAGKPEINRKKNTRTKKERQGGDAIEVVNSKTSRSQFRKRPKSNRK